MHHVCHLLVSTPPHSFLTFLFIQPRWFSATQWFSKCGPSLSTWFLGTFIFEHRWSNVITLYVPLFHSPLSLIIFTRKTPNRTKANSEITQAHPELIRMTGESQTMANGRIWHSCPVALLSHYSVLIQSSLRSPRDYFICSFVSANLQHSPSPSLSASDLVSTSMTEWKSSELP